MKAILGRKSIDDADFVEAAGNAIRRLRVAEANYHKAATEKVAAEKELSKARYELQHFLSTDDVRWAIDLPIF